MSRDKNEMVRTIARRAARDEVARVLGSEKVEVAADVPKFTTKDLQVELLRSLKEDSVAERNSVARLGATMVAVKQLEMGAGASINSEPLVLVDV